MIIKIKYYNYNLLDRKRVFLQTHNLVHTIVQFMDGEKACMHLYTQYTILKVNYETITAI